MQTNSFKSGLAGKWVNDLHDSGNPHELNMQTQWNITNISYILGADTTTTTTPTPAFKYVAYNKIRRFE